MQILILTFVLVECDEVLQFVSVDDDVQTAHLRQPELLVLHARKADLLPGPGTEQNI